MRTWNVTFVICLLIFGMMTSASGIVGKAQVNHLLIEGIQHDNPDLLQNALNRGASPNATLNGVPVLILAILKQDPLLVKILLDRGAVVNHYYGKGFTPLLVAIDGYFLGGRYCMAVATLHRTPYLFKPNPQIVELLLQKGANPNVLEPGWRLPLLERAIDQGPYCMNPRIILALVAHGASVNARDWRGQRVIEELLDEAHYRWGNSPLVDSYCQQICSILLTHGCHVNERDCNGIPLLDLAIEARLPKTVEVLVKEGADVNEKDTFMPELGVPHHTPLWTAIRVGDKRIIRFLRNHGAVLQ